MNGEFVFECGFIEGVEIMTLAPNTFFLSTMTTGEE
jgi:hypothetical protein